MIGIGPADARYPRRLLDLRGPPDPLWVDGDPAVLAARAVSIVGTRRMTPYGARVARELAATCAEAGIVVVSGLAQGVDSAAHQGALDAGGMTVAVLGAGIASYLEDARGRRRRLAHAIRTSGALITAGEARRLGRPVYAVPGPIGVAASAGANALIASGEAKALTGVEMLLGTLQLRAARRTEDDPVEDARVLDLLASSPLDPDALARRLGLGTTALAAIVARLVIRGRIASTADGRLARR